jgi:hypothetical protein
MVRRSRRSGFVHPEEELERLRPARQFLVAVCTAYPIDSDAYRCATRTIRAIDDLAEALVGDRHFLQDRPW